MIRSILKCTPAAAIIGALGVSGAALAADPMTIRLAFTTAAVGSPHAAEAAGFKAELERLAPGRFDIKLFPGGALGGERQIVEAVQLGSLDMAITGTAVLGNFVPELAVFDVPFIFRDYKHARAVLDGPLGQQLLAKMSDKGLLGLAYGEVGFRHITQNKRPIYSLADLQGLKLRTMESQIHLDAFTKLGSKPTPMSWTEIPTALQQGTIDGLESPLSVIVSSKFWETQKYLSLTGHVFTPTVHFVSPALFNRLSKADQENFRKAAAAGRDANRKYTDESEIAALKILETNGMKIEKLDTAKLAEFRIQLQPLYDSLNARYGAQLKQIANQ